MYKETVKFYFYKPVNVKVNYIQYLYHFFFCTKWN